MIIAALKEPGIETRVAITPAAVKHYVKKGFEVRCEPDAGLLSGYSDQAYLDAGATIIGNKKSLLKAANILLCVNEPNPADIDNLSAQALLIAPIDNLPPTDLLTWCSKHQISVFSMNHIPRISRAQNIDSLSSQANLAGYQAVIEAVSQYSRAIPMMMTAAGVVQPAKFLILGVGVAGLQAIATAKRLGGVVYAFDVRTAAKEQAKSLGAEFIEVPQEQDLESASGYAAETSEDYRQLQAVLIDQYAKLADIVICTALIPGKKAPILLTKKTVDAMKPGSIVVDLATSRGGNCELSVLDKIVEHEQVTLIGYSNLAGHVPGTASDLYANNLVNLIPLLTTSPPALHFNREDEIIRQAMLCHDGHLIPFRTVEEPQHG